MILAERAPWQPRAEGLLESLKHAYEEMTIKEVPAELSRVAAQLDNPDRRREPQARLALVAEADVEHRALATALLEETDLAVVECASAEAALAVLVNESHRTVFLLADQQLAGARGAQSLATTVRLLWPTVHVAVASEAGGAARRTDEAGVARLSRPWRGLDLLFEAERALEQAA
jgi:CheY-like chemotaxis protein